MSTDKTYIVEQQVVVTQEFLVTAPTKKEALRLVNDSDEAVTNDRVDAMESSRVDSIRKATKAIRVPDEQR